MTSSVETTSPAAPTPILPAGFLWAIIGLAMFGAVLFGTTGYMVGTAARAHLGACRDSTLPG
ncbi:hypothetical protein [Lichenicoccus sp.]|uniref:hypothetical protein n=1 Tax=Lichenicoccus sp. TaxID=2781899 RepID=UPI003D0A2207